MFFSICIAPMLIMLSAPGFSNETLSSKSSLDLGKTLLYVKGWSNRPSFPDSVTLAHSYTYSVLALEKLIVPEQKKVMVDFIKKCQKENGGFVSEPLYSKKTNVIFTYYALKTLFLLDAIQEINQKKTAAFLAELVRPSGGMVAQNKQDDQPTLATTYYGLESLHLLNQLEIADKQKSTQFIEQYKVKNEGFSMLPEGRTASPQATFMALSSLETLGTLSAKDRQDSGEFLLGTRYAGKIDEKQYTIPPQLRQMNFTIQALTLTSSLDRANTERMYNFIESLYISENGGFGPEPGLGTTPPSTYDAIHSLVQLGKLSFPKPGFENNLSSQNQD